MDGLYRPHIYVLQLVAFGSTHLWQKQCVALAWNFRRILLPVAAAVGEAEFATRILAEIDSIRNSPGQKWRPNRGGICVRNSRSQFFGNRHAETVDAEGGIRDSPRRNR